jgi:uncharacterized protein YkwD/uncharacterized membrane protein required for colicin V production
MDIPYMLANLPFGINVLDIIIFAIIVFYAFEGYSLGFTYAFLDLLSFVLSFILALKCYNLVANVLVTYFSMPIGIGNAVGFFFLALLCEVLMSLAFRKILTRLPGLPKDNAIKTFFDKTNHWLGILPGTVSALIVLSFLLSVIVSLPSSPLIKGLVTNSQIGSLLIANTSLFEKQLNVIFGGALNETLNFMTVKPEGRELVNLKFSVNDGDVDAQAEQEMFRLVNTERAKAGLQFLEFDDSLRDVARAHSDDMFKRGYFSHYTPDGLSPFDRMNNAHIVYTYAGENLALAPSTQLAMQGLMNSPGHRANILNPSFHKIGVGVIDGGIYGKMYSQEFTN